MQSWGLTDAGCVRKQNQDAFHIEKIDRNTLLCVVCDGMGGAKSGNIASSLAVDVFVQEVKRSWKAVMDQERIDMMLRSAVKLANFTVFDQAAQFEEFDGMGTTLVAALIHNRNATIVNVGDSRAYFIDRAGIHQVTVDHSVVQLMVSRGELTPEQAKMLATLEFYEKCTEEFRGLKVEKHEISFAQDEKGCSVGGNFVCIENIGEERKMQIEETLFK